MTRLPENLKIIYNPLRIKCLEDFNLIVDKSNKAEHFETLRYTGDKIRIVGLDVDTLYVDAKYTEIKNSKIRVIHTTGSLFLHDCEDEIEEVKATLDIVLFQCAKVNRVVADRDIFLVNNYCEPLKTCKYGFKIANRDVNQFDFMPQICDRIVIQDNTVQGTFKLDVNFKICEVKGDCSKVTRIKFCGEKYSPQEREVIVSKGAIFNGEVDGGRLLFEV